MSTFVLGTTFRLMFPNLLFPHPVLTRFVFFLGKQKAKEKGSIRTEAEIKLSSHSQFVG